MTQQKRRFLESTAATATFIGAGTVFVGNLQGVGPFVVAGEVHGDGTLTGGLTLSASARWHGNISAQQAVIAGEIIGNVTMTDKLEIGCSAVIRGKVSARTVAIAKGAIVDGEIEVTSNAAVIRFDEKRESSD